MMDVDMDKLCPTAEFVIGLIGKLGISEYFVMDMDEVSSVEVDKLNGDQIVDKLNGDQIKPEFLRYNRIITIPLVPPKTGIEGEEWGKPFLNRPQIEREERDKTGEITKRLVDKLDSEITLNEEIRLRKSARLIEIYNRTYHLFFESRLLLNTWLREKDTQFEFLRGDDGKRKSLGMLDDWRAKGKNGGTSPVDLVSLRYDVDYRNGLPTWILKSDLDQFRSSRLPRSSSSKGA